MPAKECVVVTAPEIPFLFFEVEKLPNELGYHRAWARATALANIIIGENIYNVYVKGTNTNV